VLRTAQADRRRFFPATDPPLEILIERPDNPPEPPMLAPPTDRRYPAPLVFHHLPHLSAVLPPLFFFFTRPYRPLSRSAPPPVIWSGVCSGSAKPKPHPFQSYHTDSLRKKLPPPFFPCPPMSLLYSPPTCRAGQHSGRSTRFIVFFTPSKAEEPSLPRIPLPAPSVILSVRIDFNPCGQTPFVFKFPPWTPLLFPLSRPLKSPYR